MEINSVVAIGNGDVVVKFHPTLIVEVFHQMRASLPGKQAGQYYQYSGSEFSAMPSHQVDSLRSVHRLIYKRICI